MLLKRIAYMTIAFSVNVVYAAPFGLSMGMTVEELDLNLDNKQFHIYKANSVPKPHPYFNQYILKITPGSGLCSLEAYGQRINTSGYGIEALKEYQDILKRLSKAYGKPISKNELKEGSIWNEPQDFMSSLEKKHRTVESRWKESDGLALKDDLISIWLSLEPETKKTGFLKLEYYYSNVDKCYQEINDEQDSAF
jgi:hypothetical protein